MNKYSLYNFSQETINEIKSEIFNFILEEANKGKYGLYAISSNYKNNTTPDILGNGVND